jgi:serine/threonine protein kinase
MTPATGDNPYIGPVDQPDRYQVVSVIGQGGQARVYKVSEPLGPDDAAGTAALRTEPLTPNDRSNADAFARFGQMLTNLSHHGIARVRDVFFAAAPHPGGALAPGFRTSDAADPAFPVLKCTVQDFVDGDTLSSWIGDNPDARLSTRLNLLLNPAAALDDVHAGRFTKAPVVHGDIKPSNIMVPADCSPALLVDFGLARLVSGPGTRGQTRGFNAPELAEDPAPTVAADRYAFAATTAQVLLGRPLPLTSDKTALDVDALETQLAHAPLTQYRPELCAAVIAVLKAPAEDRPTSLAQWITALRGDLSASTAPSNDPTGGPPTSPPPPTVQPQPASALTPTPGRTIRREPALTAGLVALLLVVVAAGWALGVVPGPSRPWASAPSPNSVPPATPTIGSPTVSASSPTSSPELSTTAHATESPSATAFGASVLPYRADWSTGLTGWTGTEGWTASGGMLNSNGQDYGNGAGMFAPLDLSEIPDYAVEAEIQVVRAAAGTISALVSFGVVVRMQNDGTGYNVGSCASSGIFSCATNQPAQWVAGLWADKGRTTLDVRPFKPGADWHTYRIEVRGNRITVSIDGSPALSTTDNTYISGTKVGLWSNRIQISVRRFEITALD